MNQDQNLSRVSIKIAPLVHAFCAARWPHTPRFHLNDLGKYVVKRSRITTDSASRILRDLRLKKYISYKVVSRSDSLYELLMVRPLPGKPKTTKARSKSTELS